MLMCKLWFDVWQFWVDNVIYRNPIVYYGIRLGPPHIEGIWVGKLYTQPSVSIQFRTLSNLIAQQTNNLLPSWTAHIQLLVSRYRKMQSKKKNHITTTTFSSSFSCVGDTQYRITLHNLNGKNEKFDNVLLMEIWIKSYLFE
jgi:hypothetical protein